jgi:hypothetical protein
VDPDGRRQLYEAPASTGAMDVPVRRDEVGCAIKRLSNLPGGRECRILTGAVRRPGLLS